MMLREGIRVFCRRWAESMRVYDTILQGLPMMGGETKSGNCDSDFDTGSLEIIPEKNADL